MKQETKFTPGPWKVMYSIGENRISYLAVWTAGTQEGQIGSPICKISPEYSESEIDNANAKLIAAAPMLYETLKDIMETTTDRLIYEKSKKAIAKAIANQGEGETI